MKAASRKPVILVLGTFGLLAAVALWDSEPTRKQSLSSSTNDSAPSSETPSVRHNPPPGPQAPRSQIMYLFDASLSFHHPNPDSSLMIRAVPLLGSVVRSIGAHSALPAPQRHMVATIKRTSLNQDLLCDIAVHGTNVFVPVDTVAVANELASCESRLRAVPGESYTDIAGALMFASLAMKASRPMPRVVVMFTDLAQDLPPGMQGAAPDLTGLCVGAVLDIPASDARKPGLVDRRVAEWANRITKDWRAKGFEHWHRLAFNAAELAKFIQQCEQS